VTLVALLLTSAGLVDARRAAAAADVAADRGVGPAVTVVRHAPRAAAPVVVDVTRLGIHSSLVQLRKNADGTLQVPTDFARAGWYVGSAHPGDPGPTVLVGHVDSYKGPAVFYRLRQLKQGDRITVRRADRSTVVFVVDSVRTYPKRRFPTALVYRGDGRPSLRLVTCGGAFDRRSGHYLENTVVIARPLGKRPAGALAPAVRKARATSFSPLGDASPGNHRRYG